MDACTFFLGLVTLKLATHQWCWISFLYFIIVAFFVILFELSDSPAEFKGQVNNRCLSPANIGLMPSGY